jgi:hypothetical protein
MSEYDNTNRGALFKADKRDDADRDYSGMLNIEGVEYWVSAWIKTSKKTGQKFMSLSVKAKERLTAGKTRSAAGGHSIKRELDDEIPFAPEWR